MLALIFRRTLLMVVVLWCVVTLTFFLVRLAPGGPFTKERALTPEIEQQLLKEFNLNGTLWEQYTTYLGVRKNPAGEYSGLLQGNLQLSTKSRGRSVKELISQTLPVSAVLGLGAFLLATTVGIWLGGLAAVRHHTWVDTGAMLTALTLISVPTFVVGPILVLIFALKLRWLPVGGWDSPSSLILPIITLAGPYIAYIARLMRSSMLEVLRQDFVRTAHAKGLREQRVIYKHALKVAILPVVSYLGPLAANLLTGSVVIEVIYNIPGMGGFFVNSITNRDSFLLLGVVILYCTLLVVLNLFVDLAYSWIDPRIRLGT
jgi:oligopeptide transport system permease protein